MTTVDYPWAKQATYTLNPAQVMATPTYLLVLYDLPLEVHERICAEAPAFGGTPESPWEYTRWWFTGLWVRRRAPTTTIAFQHEGACGAFRDHVLATYGSPR